MSGRATECRCWRSIDYRPALSDLSAEHLAPYLHSGQRALEIGCNRGSTALWLASRGVDILGIDINSDAISQANEEARKLSNVKVQFVEGDFLDRPDLGTFDLVLMIRVLTCFPRTEDWQALLNRCFDSLTSDGLLYIHDFVMTPQCGSYRDRYIVGERHGWRTGNFAVPGREGGMLFIAHHHSMEEITEITYPYQEIFLNFHDSVSLNGNACRMFEFLGKRRDGAQIYTSFSTDRPSVPIWSWLEWKCYYLGGFGVMCWVSAPTNDRLRVEDGSESLLQTSHADLLVLENPNVDILAFHSKSDEFPVLGVKHGKVCLPPKSSAEAKR